MPLSYSSITEPKPSPERCVVTAATLPPAAIISDSGWQPLPNQLVNVRRARISSPFSGMEIGYIVRMLFRWP